MGVDLFHKRTYKEQKGDKNGTKKVVFLTQR